MLEDLGPEKLIFIVIVLLLIFGPKKLPELGSAIGKGIREFKRSIREPDPTVQPPPQLSVPHEARSGEPAAADEQAQTRGTDS